MTGAAGNHCPSEPTEWCAGGVVVLKANKEVCLGMDLTYLNESMCR